MKRRRVIQGALPFPRRGGARKGAGRKRKDGKVGVAGPVHTPRPRLDGRTPVHVTLRLRRDVPSLRTQVGMRVVWRVFAAARERLGVRLVQWAVQRDHLHLIVEPESHGALSRGMQGLCIRLAKQLNQALGRRGRVLADRYHGVPLRSPRQTRNALAYVLLNERHHATSRGERPSVGLDACSSSPCFDGWTSARAPTPRPLARHHGAGVDVAAPRGLAAAEASSTRSRCLGPARGDSAGGTSVVRSSCVRDSGVHELARQPPQGSSSANSIRLPNGSQRKASLRLMAGRMNGSW